MESRQSDVIEKISESLEMRVNETLKDAIEQYDSSVALYVLVNVATSMLAKALIMTDPSHREIVEDIVGKIVKMKVKEGNAAVQSYVAIHKAMVVGSGSYTCQQYPPKKN
jgi:hypothetical protein